MKKLTQGQRFLLFEAYRRNMMGKENHLPIEHRWLGLGTASAYKPVLEAGLMTWACGVPHKRCMGWLRLTSEGAIALGELSAEFAVILDRMKAEGYEKTYHSQYMLMGGIVRR